MTDIPEQAETIARLWQLLYKARRWEQNESLPDGEYLVSWSAVEQVVSDMLDHPRLDDLTRTVIRDSAVRIQSLETRTVFVQRAHDELMKRLHRLENKT